jgi:hypothetical protein
VWLLLTGARRLRQGAVPLPRWSALAVVSAAAVLLVYAVVVVWYTFEASFYDAAEPTIPAVAWAFSRGQPLYPALDAPERYAHIYGPVLFVVHAAALSVLGASIASSKAVGAVAALASVLVSYRYLAARAGAWCALMVSAGSVIVYQCFANASWWTRSDPLLILAVVIGLAATHAHASLPAALLLGLSAGCAVNLKLTAPLYLLPAIVLIGSRHGLRAVAAVALTAALTAAVPFLHPRIDLAHFIDYFLLSAQNGLEFSTFRRNIEWSIFLLAPPVAAFEMRRGPDGARDLHLRFVATLVGAVALVSIAGSKPGGGPLHLLPFVPTLAYAITFDGARRPTREWRTSLLGAFAIVAVLIAAGSQALFVKTVAGRDLEAAIEEVDRVAAAHAGERIAVGYAGASHLSHARVQAVFRTNAYLLDAPAVQEHQLSGLHLPAATLRAFETCEVAAWLIPHGAPAFEVPSAYVPLGPRDVFPESLRLTFAAYYRRTARTPHFDVWTCSGVRTR